jgi:CubicO group peptidase (beta-lactamase class C family)
MVDLRCTMGEGQVTKTVFEPLRRHVEAGVLPGLIALAAHDNDVDVAVMGTRAFDDSEPLRRDAIFRIASLTKPVAAAVAMTMLDDETFALDDPVERWLPELSHPRVLRSVDAELDDTVPADRPITVEDVLTFRLGFGNVMTAPGTLPIQAAEVRLQLSTLGAPWPPTPLTPDEWIRNFATLPLMHQPGEVWQYNGGAQVLGVLLERAGGAPLESVMRDRLLDPLGMVDTRFSVPADQLSRFTTAYAPDPSTGEMHLLDSGDASSWWSRPPAFPSAAAWLVSTIDDL